MNTLGTSQPMLSCINNAAPVRSANQLQYSHQIKLNKDIISST